MHTKSPNRRRQERRLTTLEPLEDRIAPATIFVQNANDQGPGSLRQAILDANSASFPGADTISFANIGTGGPFVIQVLTPLPAITDPLTIDGYSAPGTSVNTLGVGSNAVLRVMIDGSQLGFGSGLVFESGADGSVVSGLTIGGFYNGVNESGYGVLIHANNVKVTGNFIGTNLSGTSIYTGINSGGTTVTGNGNAAVAVDLLTGSATYAGNVIGGSALKDRNVLSGNALGVLLGTESLGTMVQGNLIGPDKTGTVAIGNFESGITIVGDGTFIGGTTAGAGNVISGNGSRGIVAGTGGNTTIQGNIIGLNAAGTQAMGNDNAGIELQYGTTNVTIGGTATNAGNIISANGLDGIAIGSPVGDGSASNVTVLGNKIGTDASGSVNFGNQRHGVGVYATAGATIGGIGANEANFIAFNGGDGVALQEAFGIGVHGVKISGNVLDRNAGLGINLVGGAETAFGVTKNDANDGDTGANDLTNSPVISTFNNSGSNVVLGGSLNAKPGAQYVIEFFALAPNQVDPSGTGEAGFYLGSQTVTTDTSGGAPLSFSQAVSLPADSFFSATATEVSTNETSELSNAVGPTRTFTWTGSAGNGDWFTPQNWSPNTGFPTSNDVAIMNGGPDIQLAGAFVGVKDFQHSGGNVTGTGRIAVLQSLSWTGGTQTGPDLVLDVGASGTIGSGAGTVTWNGGSLDNYGAMGITGNGLNLNAGGFRNLGTSAVLTLNAGLRDGNGSANGTADFYNEATVDKLGTGAFGVQQFSSVLNVGLIKASAGTLVFDTVSQQGGELRLAGGNIGGTGTIILDGGTLTGAGSIAQNVANNFGTIAPSGTGATGTMTISGNYIQSSTGTLAVELSGTGAGQFDVLVVAGSAVVGGTLDVALLSGFTPANGNQFRILQSGANPGSFSTLSGAPGFTQQSDSSGLQLVASSQTFVWDNDAGDGNWFNPLNWDLNSGVPGAGDTAILNISSVIDLGTGTTATAGTFRQSAGTVRGTGSLNIVTSFDWTGGKQEGVGQTTLASGSFSGGTHVLLGRDLRASGVINWTGGDIQFDSGAFTINPGASLVMTSDADLIDTDGSGTAANFFNSGTVQKTGGSATTVFSGMNSVVNGPGAFLEAKAPGTIFEVASPFANSGVARANTSTLRLSGGGTGSGAYDSFNGQTLEFAGGTHTLGTGSVFASPGLFALSAGTLDLAGASIIANNFKQTGGTLTGVKDFTVTQSFDWSGGSMTGTGATTFGTGSATTISGSGPKTIDGRTASVQGIVNVTGSGPIAFNSGSWTIASTGVLDFQADASFADLDGTGTVATFSNDGTLKKTAGTGVASFSAFTVTNTGTVRAQSGTLDFGDGLSQTGGATELAGGALKVSGTGFALSGGELRGAGTITGSVGNSGGTIRPGGTGVVGTISITGGYTQGSGGTLAVEIGGASPAQFDSLSVGGTASFDGTLDASFLNGFTPGGGNQFLVAQSSIFTGTFATVAGSASSLSQTSIVGGIALVSAGGSPQTFVWDNSAGTGDWFDPLNWDRDSGVPGSADTAILGIHSTINLASSATVGVFQQSAGTLAGAGNLTINNGYQWSGGAIGTAVALLPASTSTISGGASKTLSGTLNVAGTLNFTGTGNLEMDGGTLTLQSGGLLDLQSDAAILDPTDASVTGTLTVDGTLRKSAGTGTSAIGGSFSDGFVSVIVGQSGLVEVQTGTLQFLADFTTDGMVRATAGSMNFTGSYQQNNGVLDLAGGTIGGGITFNLGGGELTGVGTITGNLSNGAGTVHPGGGGATGTITVTGTYDQGSDAVLEFEIGGVNPGEYDVLAVNGSALLDGRFEAALLSSFNPAAGDVFPMFTYASVSGYFFQTNLPPSFGSAFLPTAFVVGLASGPLVVNTELDVVNPSDIFTSLREAIIYANTTAGTDTITFAIPGSGSHILALSSALPAITDSLVIDGYSQPGSAVTESATAIDGEVTVIIDGHVAGSGVDGLTIGTGSSGSTIKGVALQAFQKDAGGNGGFGLKIMSDNNIVSGIVAGGVGSEDANASGGIFVSGTGNTIGGSARADRNLISGNAGPGILVNAAIQTHIEGNLIGADATGLAARSNATGIEFATGSTFTTVTGNLISGNIGPGVYFQANGGTQNTLTQNLIGTTKDGSTALGNGTGVRVGSDAIDNTIGGTAGDGNTIAFNTGNGVQVEGTGTLGVKILGNTIVGNGALAIDLGNDGTTANDATDSDIGPNDFINFPVLTSATISGAGTDVAGSLTTSVTGSVRVEFFLAATGVFLGAQDVVSTAGLPAAFTATLNGIGPGDQIVATTSDLSLAGTSEFSAAVTAIPPTLISIEDAAIVEGHTGTKQLVFKLTLDQSVTVPVSVSFATGVFSNDARAAADGIDYTATSGVATFAPGQLSTTVAITLLGDTIAEGTERFKVVLSSPSGGSLGRAEGIGAILDDDHHTFAVSQGNGNSLAVFTATPTGATELHTITDIFGTNYRGGVRVAVGDVTGDGVDDIIAGAGLGGRAKVRVFDGATFEPVDTALGDLSAFGRTYRGGVFVAAGDVDGDGRADVIVTPSAGSSNQVRIFSGADGSLLNSFRAFGKGVGGVRVAAGDVNGDGLADIIAGTGVGSSVRIFDAMVGTVLAGSGHEFRVFSKGYRGGVYVSTGDLNGDGIDDVIVGAAAGSLSVRSYLMESGPLVPDAFAGYDSKTARGVRLTTLDVNGDGIADIITSKGRRGDNTITVLDGVTKRSIFETRPFVPQLDGVYVG